MSEDVKQPEPVDKPIVDAALDKIKEVNTVPANSEDIIPVGQGVKPRVMLIVPMTHGWSYYTSFWAMRQGPRVAVRPYLHKRGGFVEDMRQKVCNEFLKSGIEWLLMCDSDTIPSFSLERAIDRAEYSKAKLVAYPTPFIGNGPGIQSNIFVAVENKDHPGVLELAGYPWFDLPWGERDEYGHRMMFPIAAAGFGCTLIHRDILVQLMEMAASGTLTDYPFRAFYDKGELVYGEDQAFFIRAVAALEIEPLTDLDCWCSHFKLVLMNPNVAREYLTVGEHAPNPTIPPDAPFNPRDVTPRHNVRPIDGISIVRTLKNPPDSKIIIP